MMDELADRLKWGRHLCDMTPDEAEAVLKALRFAGYMEKLTANGCVELSGPWRDGYEVEIDFKLFFGPDIYTAARKAVEALEKQ